jgi:GTP-binding protein
MFIDQADIYVHGGRGGNGIISFASNRYRIRGGADGGSGGSGGAVIVCAEAGISTLYRFQSDTIFRGKPGSNGGNNNKKGAQGKDIIIPVPIGTLVFDRSSGRQIADLLSAGDQLVVARGGEGGRGNKSFTTSTRQAPRICERGAKPQSNALRLELKILADAGIIGRPNAGKSSLISLISGKQAKVADYPFTTTIPNIGVVNVDDIHQFVIVDVPGLVEGAHTGKGLGVRFLKHIERTRVLVHMVDLAGAQGQDPLQAYEEINKELASFNPRLAERRQLVVGNKIDLVEDNAVEALVARFAENGIQLLPTSVVTGRGIPQLITKIYDVLQETTIHKGKTAVPWRVYRYSDKASFSVRREGDVFILTGETIEQLVQKLVLDSEDAWEYLGGRLEKMGVVRELVRRGITEGDLLRIGDVELEFRD